MVPYYPKELFVQEQMEKYFSDNSLLKLYPKKPPLTKSKSVSFGLDNLNVPSTDNLFPQLPCNPSEKLEHTSENYTKRNNRLGRQSIKTTEPLYHNEKFRLHEQRTFKNIYTALLEYTLDHFPRFK